MRLLLVFILAFFSLPHIAQAQRSDSIAAVVNGDIITFTDVYDRIDMVIKSSGMPNKKEFKERLLPQVLTNLITESVQIQEAKRLGLDTSSEEIASGFDKIAEQNTISPEQFQKILKQQNIRLSTMERQILAQLAWSKVIQREIRPRVVLSDDDINNEVARLKGKEGQTEYSLAEIVLPIDPEGGEEKTLSVAKDIKKQLSKNIQQFPAAARQFSQSSSAANGGIIGWITPDQMSPELSEAIEKLEPRTVSAPIKTNDGYVLLFIREKRVIDLGSEENLSQKFRVKMAIFTLPKDDEQGRKNTIEKASNFARDVKGCLDIVKQTATQDDIRLDEIHDTKDNIPANIFNAIEGQSIGVAAKPITTNTQSIVPMLCGKDAGADLAITALERDIETRMGTQRIDILQKRYLRDLISDAYIERRI